AKLVDHLLQDYEETGDAVIRLLALEPRHPAVHDVVEIGRREHRAWVSGVFAGSLASLEGEARARAIDALVAVTDVYTCKRLRRDMGRGLAASARAMKRLVEATVAELSKRDA